jgi:hypothetical protein
LAGPCHCSFVILNQYSCVFEKSPTPLAQVFYTKNYCLKYQPGPNPTVVIYNDTSSLKNVLRFKTKKILMFWKTIYPT